MKHFILLKAEGKFRMAKQQRGEEEASTERARKKREHDYTPGEERFKERSKRRKEEMGEMANSLFSNDEVMELMKSKRIWVPPSGRTKGYWREDPREKHNLISLLKDLLNNIRGLKKKSKFTPEQRKYVASKLKEIEPRLRHFKTQKQHMAVSKVLKEIRSELGDLDRPIKGSKTRLSKDEIQKLKDKGLTLEKIKKLGVDSARAVIWNDISMKEALGLKKAEGKVEPYIRQGKQVKGYDIWNRKFRLDFPRSNAERNRNKAAEMLKMGMNPKDIADAFPQVFRVAKNESGQDFLQQKMDVKLKDGSSNTSYMIPDEAMEYALKRFARTRPDLKLEHHDHIVKLTSGERVPVEPADMSVKTHTKDEYKEYLASLKGDYGSRELELEKWKLKLGLQSVGRYDK